VSDQHDTRRHTATSARQRERARVREGAALAARREAVVCDSTPVQQLR
jgi:hypothetical protein